MSISQLLIPSDLDKAIFLYPLIKKEELTVKTTNSGASLFHIKTQFTGSHLDGRNLNNGRELESFFLEIQYFHRSFNQNCFPHTKHIKPTI